MSQDHDISDKTATKQSRQTVRFAPIKFFYLLYSPVHVGHWRHYADMLVHRLSFDLRVHQYIPTDSGFHPYTCWAQLAHSEKQGGEDLLRW